MMQAAHPARAQRSARNQLLFRAVNEQILEMTERFRAQLAEIDIVCECADPSCTGTIRVDIDEFARVEQGKDAFAVLPGHEDVRVEEVLDRNSRFFVVRRRSVGSPLKAITTKPSAS